ncbi:MAG TPA: cellulase family glycosylhydrolase [Thermomicrobiales bacterium]|nr:cellulase family glycosylhydrolase [Thermomicrobiales bacterium]
MDTGGAGRTGRVRLRERRWFRVLRVLLHVAALGGLALAAVGSHFAEPYFIRGVATGAMWDPIPWTAGNPMAVNTFLNEEPDPANVERTLDMVRDGGFGMIRQLFGWYEIEPQPGVFVDAQGRSTWEKYDRIVDGAAARGLDVLARLEKPPAWALAGRPNPQIEGPPDDLADYGAFVERFVERYRGKVRFVQIWNEPNLEGEWGGGPIDPPAYVELLKVGYEAAKRADPDVVVLMAGLAPTDQRGPANLSDLLFLQQMYDAGAADYFDIAAAMVYGYGYSPYDRRVDFARNNFSRPIQTREIMVRNGDGNTPLWAVEYGWVSLPDDWAGDPSPWGKPVSEEQQAEYLVGGYERAQREWPWMGRMAVWAFRFPHGPEEPDQVANPTRGFAIVNHDFTPRPAYVALQQAAPRLRIDGAGSYLLSDAQVERLLAGEPVDLQVRGQRVDLVAGGSGTLFVTAGGRARDQVHLDGDGRVTLVDGLRYGAHLVTLQLDSPSGAQLAPIGYVVSSESVQTWIYPWITGALVAAIVLNLVSAGWMAWEYRRRRRSSGTLCITDREP